MENKKNSLVYPEHKCACCGEHVFTTIFGICPVCGWEDDAFQNKHPDFRGGANHDSLNDHKAWFTTKRATKPDFNWGRDSKTRAGEEDDPKKSERPKK
jgi:ribosomal protein L37E